MKEHIAPVANGFHVSLRGTFGATSRVAIAYTTFGYIGNLLLHEFIVHLQVDILDKLEIN